jgi:hypothetical protein
VNIKHSGREDNERERERYRLEREREDRGGRDRGGDRKLLQIENRLQQNLKFSFNFFFSQVSIPENVQDLVTEQWIVELIAV